jgi:RNA recognition motif-containing protein
MTKKLYVGNLNYDIGSEELERIFGEFGDIEDAVVISDRQSGRSKGFGFVTFASDENAQEAIDNMNGKEIEGRALTVNVAKPRENRGGGGGGGRGGYGGGGGRGGRGGYGGGGGRRY